LGGGLGWSSGCGCSGIGGFLTLRNGCLALNFAHFLFKGVFEVAAGFAKFRHEFAKSTGKFGQLVRAENDQNNDKDHDHMWNAEHSLEQPFCVSMSS
jgi:hypothetical protein